MSLAKPLTMCAISFATDHAGTRVANLAIVRRRATPPPTDPNLLLPPILSRRWPGTRYSGDITKAQRTTCRTMSNSCMQAIPKLPLIRSSEILPHTRACHMLHNISPRRGGDQKGVTGEVHASCNTCTVLTSPHGTLHDRRAIDGILYPCRHMYTCVHVHLDLDIRIDVETMYIVHTCPTHGSMLASNASARTCAPCRRVSSSRDRDDTSCGRYAFAEPRVRAVPHFIFDAGKGPARSMQIKAASRKRDVSCLPKRRVICTRSLGIAASDPSTTPHASQHPGIFN